MKADWTLSRAKRRNCTRSQKVAAGCARMKTVQKDGARAGATCAPAFPTREVVDVGDDRGSCCPRYMMLRWDGDTNADEMAAAVATKAQKALHAGDAAPVKVSQPRFETAEHPKRVHARLVLPSLVPLWSSKEWENRNGVESEEKGREGTVRRKQEAGTDGGYGGGNPLLGQERKKPEVRMGVSRGRMPRASKETSGPLARTRQAGGGIRKM